MTLSQEVAPPDVSVVIPCYNSEATLTRAIESVIAQPGAPAQVIVVDDGSTDGSARVARAFGSRISLLGGANGGVCSARNRGLRMARGGYVLFLDADDSLEGDTLAAGARRGAAEAADIVLCPLKTVAAGKAALHDPSRRGLAPETLFEHWLGDGGVNQSSILFRRGFLEDIGGWNERIAINHDGEMMLRALLERPKVAFNPEGLGVYFQGNPTSMSARHSAAKYESLLAALEILLDRARAEGFAAHTSGIEMTIYWLARSAYRAGWPATAEKALTALRDRGLLRHHGSPAHRLAATLFGLRRKVRIWGS